MRTEGFFNKVRMNPANARIVPKVCFFLEKIRKLCYNAFIVQMDCVGMSGIPEWKLHRMIGLPWQIIDTVANPIEISTDIMADFMKIGIYQKKICVE